MQGEHMITKSGKSMKMALALMFTASAGAFVAASPAVAQTQNETAYFTAYAGSGYNYCDAKIMGAFYGFDPYRGKLEIGAKIVNGISDNIKNILSSSRARGKSCSWNDLPHSYEDAVALAGVWGVDPGQAKTKAAAFYTNGQSGYVNDMLRYGGTEQSDRNVAFDRFFASGFTYCDAKLIGDLLGETATEGKIFIGQKIGFGLIDNIPDYLNNSRSGGNKCRWGEVPYDYDDAAKLAAIWSMDIGGAKTAIANMVTAGRSDVVDASLGRT